MYQLYQQYWLFSINFLDFIDIYIKKWYIIYVYQQTKLNGKKYQQIDIYYAGVGIIGIPLTEYELKNAFQQSIKNIKTT